MSQSDVRRAPAARPRGDDAAMRRRAARARRDGSRHGPIAQLLFAWAPLSLILLAYWAAERISSPLGRGDAAGANRWGFPLHVEGPADLDRSLFGVVPSVWLQQHLVDGSAHWYDAAAALVYVTHFVSIPVVTGLVWFRLRERFAAWVAAVIVFTVVGMSGYVVYPAAPPWLASDMGAVGQVARLSDLGWDYLHLEVVGRLTALGQGASNPVAAMPSLHAGSPLLITLFLWPLVGRWWRGALLGYVLLMALTLVYTGEHYVVDVVAGWLTATVAVVTVALVRRRRGTPGRCPPRGWSSRRAGAALRGRSR